jgi:hypothetical protein
MLRLPFRPVRANVARHDKENVQRQNVFTVLLTYDICCTWVGSTLSRYMLPQEHYFPKAEQCTEYEWKVVSWSPNTFYSIPYTDYIIIITEQDGVAAALWSCIRNVLSSNIGLETHFPDCYFVILLSSSRKMLGE